jgi:hypothetical protein
MPTFPSVLHRPLQRRGSPGRPGQGSAPPGSRGGWPPPRGPAATGSPPPQQPPGRRGRAPLVLGSIAVLVAMMAVVIVSSLDRASTGSRRPMVPLLAASGAARGGLAVLTESPRFAQGPLASGARFDAGWVAGAAGGRPALVPAGGTARLLVVNLGEELQHVLTLDLARVGLPEGERLSIRTGDRELARATLSAASLPLRVHLPEDLPIGLTPLDLVFSPAGTPAGAPPVAASPAVGPAGRAAAGAGPGAGASLAVYGAEWSPVLPPGTARVDGDAIVQDGNCLVYLACNLAGNEALVGAFEPPADARPGQRFDLSIERLDGTPIRRFHWLPSFWNRLRGARRFELPLRGARGPARVRLTSRAGDAGGPPGRWRGLGLANVTGEILSPGQGQ